MTRPMTEASDLNEGGSLPASPSVPSGDVAKTVAHLWAMLSPKIRPADPKVEAISTGHLQHAETVYCADGFSMSVQASRFHYCSPRDSHGPWYEVEVGFPSAKVEAFMPYIDGGGSEPTDTVYGYVPIETVAQEIIDHGGFKATTAPETVSVGMEGEARNAPNSPPSRATGEA